MDPLRSPQNPGIGNGHIEDMERKLGLFGLFTLCLIGILGGRYAYIRTKYPIILKKIGKLFSKKMIEQWLFGEKIALRYDYFNKKN